MAETANNPLPLEDEDQFQEETLSERFMDWVRTDLVWYAGSFSFHLLALSMVLLLPNFSNQDNQGDAPVLEAQARRRGAEGTREVRQGGDWRNRGNAPCGVERRPHFGTAGPSGPGRGI